MIGNNQNNNSTIPAFLHLGFRPFFFIAAISAVILMIVWLLVQQSILSITNSTANHWHAHEMIFGYSSAVIIGFLLTASKNWSGIQTIYNKKLLALLIIWILGRFLPFVDSSYIIYFAIIDISFLVLSTIAISHPIIKAKLWGNLAIDGKILLLAVAHIIYYLGLFEVIKDGQNYGLYLAFYLIISLLLMMSRRLVPFFIEGALGLKTKLKNSKFLDISSLILFLIFIVLEVFYSGITSNIIAGLLFVIHSIRAFWWFNNGIWGKPLLWSIYLAYCFLALGFGIKFLTGFLSIMPNIDIHAFAFGISLMTLSMMARISLGHTGRNVFNPPKPVNIIFILLSISFVSRVVMPVLLPIYYYHWILTSQILWIISFLIFAWTYAPILFKARIDGRFG